MNENVECSETKMNLRVTLDWRTTLATAVLLPTLLFLGFWQLDRADEKIDLIARMDDVEYCRPLHRFKRSSFELKSWRTASWR